MTTATTPPPAASSKLLTAAEFMATVGGELGVDLVDGRVEYQPMPHRHHGMICNNVGFVLTRFLEDHDLGRVMSCDTHVRIADNPDTLRGADVLFVSYKRFPKENPTDGVVDPPPELVAEVWSPSATWASQMRKALDYTTAGVDVVLLLDPDERTVTVVRPTGKPQTLGPADTLSLPDILPGFSTPVARLFKF